MKEGLNVSQDRILGSMVLLQVYTPGGPVAFAELDSFTAKNTEELKKYHPLGEVQPHGQLVYGGWDISFKGAKVDNSWDLIQAGNDNALLAGNAAPRYRIVETTTWFNGNVETWIYDNVLIHGLNCDKAMANEEIKMDFSGFAPTRLQPGGNPIQGVLNTGGSLSNI